MIGNVNSQPRLCTITASCSPAHANPISSPRTGPGNSRRVASAIDTSDSIMNSAAVELK